MESKKKPASSKRLKNRLVELLLEKSRQEKRRITQSELAAETGIGNNTISGWATDKQEMTKIDVSVLKSLCVYFNCEVGDLLYLEDAPDENPP